MIKQKMNFSEAFRQTNELCRIAPNGKYLASAIGFRLVVRDMSTLQIQKLFACVDDIEQIKWSGDSEFIMCCLYKRGKLQFWWLDDPLWECKIEEGGSGLAAAIWTPDSRHIITTAEFHLRMTIWSLTSKSISYIKHPKPCEKGLDFSSDGTLMVVAERRHQLDYVSVFTTHDWTMLEHFALASEDLESIDLSPDCSILSGALRQYPELQISHFALASEDLERIDLSPDCSTLAVCESCLKYGVFLYNIKGDLVARYTAYDNALGIKTVCWSSTSQFLAIGSFDEKVRVLNNVTWKPSLEAHHPSTVDAKPVLVYRESARRAPDLPQDVGESTALLFSAKSKYEVLSGEVQIPDQRPHISQACPNVGVSNISFSTDGSYMFTRNENMNRAVWLWNMRTMSLSTVLIQKAPIKDVQWDPCTSRLAMCTGSDKVYMWSETGCLTVTVPVKGSFSVQSLQWSRNENALLLLGHNEFCVCYLH